jgi:transposase
LKRIDSKNEKYTLEKFYEKQSQFGTISMFAKKGLPANKVYVDYKTRGEVETMIDAFKNIYDADRTYMQNEVSLEAWMFVNFLALMFYYKILNLLKNNNLNSEYSPQDFIMYLREIKKVKINDKIWVDSVKTNATEKIINKLKIMPIT